MASIKIGNVTYGAEELSRTFQTYRKDFIVMSLLAMAVFAKHCNVRMGIRYRETVSQMSSDAEIGNYSKTKHEDEDADVCIDPRIFQTYFGNVIKGSGTKLVSYPMSRSFRLSRRVLMVPRLSRYAGVARF